MDDYECKYKIVVLCLKKDNNAFDDFLLNVSAMCDGIIVVDTTNKQMKPRETSKILSYKYLCDNKTNPKQVLWETAVSIGNIEWVLFMTSDERLDVRFPIYFNNNSSNTKFVHKLIVNNIDSYYVLPNTETGIYTISGLYRVSQLSWSDVENTKSDNMDCLNESCQLLIHSPASSNDNILINIYTPRKILDGLYWDGCMFQNYVDVTNLQAKIKQKVVDISLFLIQLPDDHSANIGLYTGMSGTVLLLSQMYMYNKSVVYSDAMFRYIERIEEIIINATHYPPMFSTGIAGFGWLISHLHEKEILEISDDHFDDFDGYLREVMREMHEFEKFDQLHGMIGVARYFLKRKLVDDIRYVIETIANYIEYDISEFRWKRNDEQPFSYDFGLAHGMAGILYFLGKCYELGIETDLCKKIGDGIVRFYKNNEGQYNQNSSYFPNYILESEYNKGERTENDRTRLAWCYGDLSILLSVYQFARRTDNNILEKEALVKLIKISERRDCYDTKIKDTIICHGSSSLVLMYNRLYQDSQCMEFRDAAIYWTKVTIAMGYNSSSPTGYLFVPDAADKTIIQLEHRDSLLEGVGGVGLTLLSVLDPKNMDWDECLMLS